MDIANNEKTAGNGRGWAIVLVSFLILMFIFATCISCMGVYVIPVSESLNIPRTSFSLVTTVQAVAMMVSAMPAGKLLEKYSMKVLMACGAAAGALCMFIFSIAPSIVYFYPAGILMGVSVSFTCNIPISMLIKNWFDERREGFALGLAFVGSGAGAMILNPLYTYIIASYGWRTSFFVSGVLMLVILVPMIFFIVARSPDELKKLRGGKRVRISGTDDRDPAEQDERQAKVRTVDVGENSDLTLKDSIKKPQTWAVFFAYVVLTFISMAILNHGIPFMTDYGLSSSTAAFVISLSSGVLIIGKVLVGALYGRFGIRRVTVVETALVTLCITVFWLNGMVDSMAAIGLFVLLYGIGVPVATLSMPLVLPVMYGKSDFGAIMGMFSMASGIGGIFQVVVSMIYDSTGSYYPAWVLMSILCLISVFIFAAAVKPLKKRRTIVTKM